MSKATIPPEKVAEIKKKYPDVTDELLTDLANAIDVEGGDDGDGNGGNGDGGKGLDNLGLALKEGDMTFTQLMFWLERQDRKERYEEKQEERRREERLRQEKPPWLEPVLTRLEKLEEKKGEPQSETSKFWETQLNDLKDKLAEQKTANETVLADLREERTKAKDEAQRTYIDGKINEVNASLKRLEDLLGKTTTPDKKDFFDQLQEVQTKGKLAGIEITVGQGSKVAKDREEVAIDAAQGVVSEGKEVLKDARLLVKEISEGIVLPRMRVDSGASKTSLLSDKEKMAYYEKLGLSAK